MSCTNNIITPLRANESQSVPWIAPGLDITNPTHRRMIRHLYSRIGYGASYADIISANGQTISQLVDTIINGAKNVPLPSDVDWTSRYIHQAIDENNNKLGASGITNLFRNYWVNEYITEAVKSKLALFWRNHFVAEEGEFTIYSHRLRYYKTIYNNAFGNFKEFVKKIGREPLMLDYLDGAKAYGEPSGNYEPSEEPNENYARELLELFTMGTSYQGSENYDDFDIAELSRVFTGWRLGEFNWDNGDTHDYQINPLSFRPAIPNESNVRVESWTYNHSTIPSDGIYIWLFDSWTYNGTGGNFNASDLGEYTFQYGHHDWTTKTVFGEPIDPASFLDNHIFHNTLSGTNHSIALQKVLNTSVSDYSKPESTVIGTPMRNYGDTTNPNYRIEDPLTGIDYTIDDSNINDILETIHFNRGAEHGILAKTCRGIGFLTAADYEYNLVHDAIFRQRTDEIGYFICKKLYEFYIYGGLEDIKDDTLRADIDAYIEELSTVFKTNWSIEAVLKKLFKSEHFYDTAIMGTSIKSHIGSAVSFFRSSELAPGWGTWDAANNNYDYIYRFELLDPAIPNEIIYTSEDGTTNLNAINRDGSYIPVNTLTGEGGTPMQNSEGKALRDASHTMKIQTEAALMGQRLAAPPDVAGWPGHRFWLNEFTLIKRQQLLDSFLNSLPHDQPPTADNPTPQGFTLETKRKLRLLAKIVFDIAYPGIPYDAHEEVVRALWEHFFAVAPYEEFAEDGTTRIGQIGGALNAYLCDSDNCYTVNISQDTPEMAERVTSLLTYFIKQPEFQLV